MNQTITITWLGHACFRLESGGHTVVLDPFEEGSVPGFKSVRGEANAVLMSHHHRDHGWAEGITLVEGADAPYTLTKVPSFHDPEGGRLRGENTIHVLDYDGLRLAHFGDLGCELSDEALAAIGRVDIAMIPVGGYYTIDAEEAMRLITRLRPGSVIPMHYRGDGFGLTAVGGLEAFLTLCEEGDVVRLGGDSLVAAKQPDRDETLPERAVILVPSISH